MDSTFLLSLWYLFLNFGGWLLDTVSPVLFFFDRPRIYDESRLYKLPYREGKTVLVAQGYDGAFSHSGRNALDFNMVEGTDVVAARAGTVIQVEDSYTEGCPFGGCLGNFIAISHEATQETSYYFHLKPGGACVEISQTVEQGDVIGKSGSTGFSTVPHLHFEVLGAVDDEPTFADVRGDGIPTVYGFYTSANAVGVNYCDS